MVYSLLIDIEVLDFLQDLPPSARRKVFNHIRKFIDYPERYSDYIHYDNGGRRLDVCVFSGYAIYYWIDFADRHVKVLRIRNADKNQS
jgi:mRNA-degrading endonuclease RelE of RelBE toxin-antitoxin system